MNIKQLILILVIMTIFCCNKLLAQDTIPVVYDFMIQVNEKRMADFNAKPDSAYAVVTFKLTNIAKAGNVIIKLGTAQGLGNIITQQISITSRNGIYYLTGSDNETKLWKNFAAIYSWGFGISVANTITWGSIQLFDKNNSVVGTDEYRVK